MAKKKKPPTETQLAALAAYGAKRGEPTRNPNGRPRTHKEMVAKLRAHGDWISDAILGLIHKGLTAQLTASDRILSDHLWEAWQAMYGRHPQSILLANGLDVGDHPDDPSGTSGLSALLQRAQLHQTKRAAPPLAPVEPEPTRVAEGDVLVAPPPASGFAPWPAKPPPPAPAPEPTFQGADVTPPTPHNPKYDGKPDPLAPSPPPPAPRPVKQSEPPYRGRTVSEGDPDPDEPPYRGRAVPRPKRPPPGAPYMDGHAEFLSERDTSKRDDDMVRLQEEARRQGRPGGQVPLSEMKPDARPQQEFVNFTLAGNGRIKRC